MRKILTTIILTSTLNLASFSIAAEEGYYVWVDENGVTNYSERNPREQNAEHISKGVRFGEQHPTKEEDSTPDNKIGGPASTKTEVDPDALISKERIALKAEIAKTKRSNCEIGKRNLLKLQSYGRVKVKDEQGEVRTLSDAEKRKGEDEARKVIQENCSG